VVARGWCDGHYRQWRQGRPLTALRPRKSPLAVQDLTPRIVRLWHEGLSSGQIGQELSLNANVVRAALLRNGIDTARRHPRTTAHGSFSQWQAGCECDVCLSAKGAYIRAKHERRKATMSDAEKVTEAIKSRAARTDRQHRTVPTATRKGSEWTAHEVELAAREDLTIEQVAVLTHRTYEAVANTRAALSNPRNKGHARFRRLLGLAPLAVDAAASAALTTQD
jgi:DNA-binding CsgD family transcriptional regulator